MKSFLRSASLLATGMLLALSAISAASVTWTGAGDSTTWRLASNWDTNTSPLAKSEFSVKSQGSILVDVEYCKE